MMAVQSPRNISRSLSISCSPRASISLSSLRELPKILLETEGFSPLLDELKRGRSVTVDGAWGSSAGLVAATLAQQAHPTFVVVLPHPGQLDSWVEDLANFAGERPIVFPAAENDAGDRDGVDDLARQRLRLLRQLD